MKDVEAKDDVVSQSLGMHDGQHVQPPKQDVLATFSEDVQQVVENLINERAYQMYEMMRKEEEGGQNRAKKRDEEMQSQINKLRKLQADANRALSFLPEKPLQPTSSPMTRQQLASLLFPRKMFRG